VILKSMPLKSPNHGKKYIFIDGLVKTELDYVCIRRSWIREHG